MHPDLSRLFRRSLLIGLASVALVSPPAHAQTTTWFGSTGNWNTAANWSNGLPTADLDAILTAAGTAQVTAAGPTCRNLFVGTAGAGPSVTISGGSLSVVHRIQVPRASSGTIRQTLGAVSADSLVLGAASSIGQYQMSGGTLTINHLVIGTNETASTGQFTTNIANPVMTVTHTLTIGRGANIVHGAGTLNAGTSPADSVVVLGAWQMINRPNTHVTNFVLRDGASLTATILFNGITPVIASGAVRLDGTLIVGDLAAPNGTYELLRGNSLTGTFDTVNLPAVGDWSWRIEGNALLVTKGPVAVEATTWSRIKAGAGPSH